MPYLFKVFCMVSESPSSRLSYATRSNSHRYLQSCIIKLLLPLPLLPQINHTPVRSGSPKASFHSPLKAKVRFFCFNTSFTVNALIS